MTKRLTVFAVTVLLLMTTLLSPLSVGALYELPSDKQITATSAVVVYLGSDQQHDMLMFEQNADAHLAPAGLVRIMVGLYALKTMEDQQIDPNVATATYTADMQNAITDTGLSTVNMEVGDTWKLQDLLAISMIQTAADALTTLVTSVSGSQEAFVDGMNTMLTEVGCTDTHFQNIYGLDNTEQYTSARDMYRMLRYATLNYPALITLLENSEYTVQPVTGDRSSWPSTNEMLRSNSEFYYSPLVYGRSGYTESAGQSCASVARDSGFEYMTVVMGCKDAEGTEGLAFTDSMTLFRWVYNAFSYQKVISKNQPISRTDVHLAWRTDSVALVAGEDFEGMLRDDADVNTLRYDIQLNEEYLEAPVEKGQVCGSAVIYDGDIRVGSVDLCAAETISRSQLLAVLDMFRRIVTSPVMLIIFAALACLFIGYVIIGMVHNRSRRKKKQKRVKHYR